MARGVGPCECTVCQPNCPQDLRLKRGRRSRLCWYCDIGQHPRYSPPAFFPALEPETKPLNSVRPGHPPAVPNPSTVAQSSRGEAPPEGVDLTAATKVKGRGAG